MFPPHRTYRDAVNALHRDSGPSWQAPSFRVLSSVPPPFRPSTDSDAQSEGRYRFILSPCPLEPCAPAAALASLPPLGANTRNNLQSHLSSHAPTPTVPKSAADTPPALAPPQPSSASANSCKKLQTGLPHIHVRGRIFHFSDSLASWLYLRAAAPSAAKMVQLPAIPIR